MSKDVILKKKGEQIFPITKYENILNKPALDNAIGIPIVTQEILDNLPSQDVPNDYIMINNDPTEASDSGDYISIMFSAIRKLQAEVAKLRNSFRYGISSYTGTDVAMSQIVSEYSEIQENEPL